MVFIILLATIASTFLGGLFALRFRDKLHLVLGFSAGAVVGLAFFDLLPESIALASLKYDAKFVILLMAIGFASYLLIDRFFSLHAQDHCEGEENCENSSHRGKLGASTLIFHSFLDGLGIGLAFKVSPAVGWVVAAAVLAHDFSDGINTVSMIIKDRGQRREAIQWLLFDALAPALGIFVTLFINIPQAMLGLLLAVFAGLFFYIGASDLIPESHHHHPAILTTIMTILGMAVLYAIIHFVG